MKAKIIKKIHAHIFKDDADTKGETINLYGMTGETTPAKFYTTGARKEQWFTPTGYHTSVLVHPNHMQMMEEETVSEEAASNVSGGTNLSSASGQVTAPNTTNLEGYSLPFKKRKNHVGVTVPNHIFARLKESVEISEAGEWAKALAEQNRKRMAAEKIEKKIAKVGLAGVINPHIRRLAKETNAPEILKHLLKESVDDLRERLDKMDLTALRGFARRTEVPEEGWRHYGKDQEHEFRHNILAHHHPEIAEDFGPRSDSKTPSDPPELSEAVKQINSYLKNGEKVLVECGGEVLLLTEAFTPKLPTDTNVHKFLKDYLTQTGAHPFDDRMRLHDNYVGSEMSPFSGMVHLHSIINFGNKGNGAATTALKHITSLADKHGVTLHLSPKPFRAGSPEAGLNAKNLKAWYGRHGFVSNRSEALPAATDMIRHPQPVSESLFDGKFRPSRAAATTKAGVQNHGSISFGAPTKAGQKTRRIGTFSGSAKTSLSGGMGVFGEGELEDKKAAKSEWLLMAAYHRRLADYNKTLGRHTAAEVHSQNAFNYETAAKGLQHNGKPISEARVENYHSVFFRDKKDPSAKWAHHFDADNKEDADSERHFLRGQGMQTLRLTVPKDSADWTKVDPHEYVTKRLSKT